MPRGDRGRRWFRNYGCIATRRPSTISIPQMGSGSVDRVAPLGLAADVDAGRPDFITRVGLVPRMAS